MPQKTNFRKTHRKNNPLEKTAAYETYWHFACERQKIFFKRLEGSSWPWTEDQVLNEHKFTNAYRASDRVSQYLIKNVIYKGDESLEETFFRIILFKIFNKIETWESFLDAFGEVTWEGYKFENYNKVLCDSSSVNKRIYSAAYIMPSGGRNSIYRKKHQFHLKLLESMMDDRAPDRIAEMSRMEDAFEALLSYPSIGRFLAYQYVTDLNYSSHYNWSEMDFVCAGPGAKDGIRKCFRDTGGYSDEDIIRMMADIQGDEFSRLGLSFKSLWGRSLQLIDCQNLFCEVDKYSRVAHPEIKGISGRERIKQKFYPVRESVVPWYPPKWNINERIKKSSSCP